MGVFPASLSLLSLYFSVSIPRIGTTSPLAHARDFVSLRHPHHPHLLRGALQILQASLLSPTSPTSFLSV